jgi:hypothetical protein
MEWFSWNAITSHPSYPIGRPRPWGDSGVQAGFPISRLPVHVLDGYDPDAIRFVLIDHRVGKDIREVASRSPAKDPKPFRVTPHILNQSLDLVIKTPAQLLLNICVVFGSLLILIPAAEG